MHAVKNAQGNKCAGNERGRATPAGDRSLAPSLPHSPTTHHASLDSSPSPSSIELPPPPLVEISVEISLSAIFESSVW